MKSRKCARCGHSQFVVAATDGREYLTRGLIDVADKPTSPGQGKSAVVLFPSMVHTRAYKGDPTSPLGTAKRQAWVVHVCKGAPNVST